MRMLLFTLAFAAIDLQPVVAAEEQAAAEVLPAVEVFNNVGKYAGRDVLIAEGEIVSASVHGALLRAGDDVFFELRADMDAGALQFMITSCAGSKGGRDQCRVPVAGKLLPAVSATTGWPVLIHARIISR